MVKIRLKRLGRKKRPFFRIIVIDVRARREGAALAELGFYNPLSKELKLDKAAAQDWVKKGAIPTPTVERLIQKAPESGELIILEKAQKERLSKKAADRQKQEAEAKANAEAEAQKAAAEAKAASIEAEAQAAAEAAQAAPPEEAPAAETAEAPAEA